MKDKYSPLIEKNLDYIRNHNYEIFFNNHQLYKKIGKYELLITDYSSRPFEIDLWYIIGIDVWVKDSNTDIIIQSKRYSGNFFFPSIKRIEQFVQKSIKQYEKENNISEIF